MFFLKYLKKVEKIREIDSPHDIFQFETGKKTHLTYLKI